MMDTEKSKDIRDTAVKLGAVYAQSPTDYAYIKGWIHCLLQRENDARSPRKPSPGCSQQCIPAERSNGQEHPWSD